MKSRWVALLLAAIVSVIGGFVAPHDPEHGRMWWDRIGVFYAVFGFLGCVAIIFVSKALGKWMLQRREDYYDRD